MDRPLVPLADLPRWKIVSEAFRRLHRASRTYIVIGWMLTVVVVILTLAHPHRPFLLFQPNHWDELTTTQLMLAAFSWIFVGALLALSVDILLAKIALTAPHDKQVRLIAVGAILLDVLGLGGGGVALVLQGVMAWGFVGAVVLGELLLWLSVGQLLVELFALVLTMKYVWECGMVLESPLLRQGERRLTKTFFPWLLTNSLAFLLLLAPVMQFMVEQGLSSVIFVALIVGVIFQLGFSYEYLMFLDNTHLELDRLLRPPPSPPGQRPEGAAGGSSSAFFRSG